MKSFRKIITSLSIVVALLGGGALLLFGLPMTGWKALTVQTGSMSPNIPTGSMVFVHSVPPSSLKVGDVITYASLQKKGQTISHRITQNYVADGRVPGFVTKGDANKVADAPILAGQVKGKVMFSVPYLGNISKLLKTWPAIVALIYLPSLFVISEEMKRLAAYYRKQMPYVLHGYNRKHAAGHTFKPSKAAFGIFAGLMAVTSVWALPAYAQFQTNSVALVGNQISVITDEEPEQPPANPGNTTTCNSTTNVNVSNNTSQTATTGSVNNSGNTTTGGASSGNASNSSSSSTTVTVNGCSTP
jgi:signal peptidase I